MPIVIPLPRGTATQLADLAWELTCSAGVAAGIDKVRTEAGAERCVTAHCLAGEQPFRLIPRGPACIEVWWAEDEGLPVSLVGYARSATDVLALAEHAGGAAGTYATSAGR